MSVQTANPLMSLLTNPTIAGLIDNAAGTLVPVPQGAATAQAAATANTKGNTNTKLDTAANKAGAALGKLFGESVGSSSKGGTAVSQFVGGFVQGMAEGLEQSMGNFCPGEPSPDGNKPPSQPTQMTVDSDGKVHTPGGYTIEATSQYCWKITGPDGNTSEVWGDPHVRQKDKDGKVTGTWDFKNDATFVLDDGTKINVQCKPYNNMTVSSTLEIWRDGEEVDITDIDKGKGKVGQVQTNAHEDVKTEQTFMEGTNAADWLYNAFQITGNTAEGADHFTQGQFELGQWGHNNVGGWGGNYGNGMLGIDNAQGGIVRDGPMVPQQPVPAPKPPATDPKTQATQALLKILGGVLEVLKGLLPLLQKRAPTQNPYTTPDPAPPKTTTPPKYDPNQHAQGLQSAFQAIGTMLQVLGEVMQMAAALKGMRAQGTR